MDGQVLMSGYRWANYGSSSSVHAKMARGPEPVVYSYKVIKEYPHATDAFTQVTLALSVAYQLPCQPYQLPYQLHYQFPVAVSAKLPLILPTSPCHHGHRALLSAVCCPLAPTNLSFLCTIWLTNIPHWQHLWYRAPTT